MDALFKGLYNGFGPLDDQPDILARLRRVLLAPTLANWLNAYGLIIRRHGTIGPWMTLVQAVIEVEATLPPRPRLAPKTLRIPDTLLIARALRYAQRPALPGRMIDCTKSGGAFQIFGVPSGQPDRAAPPEPKPTPAR